MHVYHLETFLSRGLGHVRAASNGPRTPDILKTATKHRRHYSMPQPRRHRRGPKPDRRRALELLAASRDGCTEAMLRAHGFSVRQIVDLVRAGLATAHSQRVVAGGGGRTIEAARVKITEAGRQALTEDPA